MLSSFTHPVSRGLCPSRSLAKNFVLLWHACYIPCPCHNNIWTNYEAPCYAVFSCYFISVVKHGAQWVPSEHEARALPLREPARWRQFPCCSVSLMFRKRCCRLIRLTGPSLRMIPKRAPLKFVTDHRMLPRVSGQSCSVAWFHVTGGTERRHSRRLVSMQRAGSWNEASDGCGDGPPRNSVKLLLALASIVIIGLWARDQIFVRSKTIGIWVSFSSSTRGKDVKI
jgi:hypothetical protein